ncbi:MAG: hypothetical protein ACKVRP_04135 [Bacteroidota bacterium]
MDDSPSYYTFQLIDKALPMLAALAGATIAGLFSYLSIKKQFWLSITHKRIDRAVESGEALLEVLLAAEINQTMEGGHPMSPALHIRNFPSWYPQFIGLWHQKQYLLDRATFVACEDVANIIGRFVNRFPHFRTGEPVVFERTPEVAQEIFAFHAELLQSLPVAREALTSYLNHLQRVDENS